MSKFGSKGEEYSLKFYDPISIKKHEASHRSFSEYKKSTPSFDASLGKKQQTSHPIPVKKHEASHRMSYDNNNNDSISPPLFPKSPPPTFDVSPGKTHEALSQRMSYEYNRTSSGRMFDQSFSMRSGRMFDQSFSMRSGRCSQDSSPLTRSPWHCGINDQCGDYSYTGLMGSLFRQEGSIYSLATSGDLLYTGSESKNIRVWKNQKEFSSFKSNSGLVKAIIISGGKIFTGHQDGKIRVWKVSKKNPNVHKRVGTLPTMRAYLKSSINPANYVETRKDSKSSVWLKHFDAISSLSLTEDRKFLYSASWDKTIKVWRAIDFKFLETINAHDDAVNSVVVGFDGLVFSGSADGSVKVWRREIQGKGTKHHFSQTLLKQECAVTALSVDPTASILYCGSSDGLVNFWERERSLSHGGVLRCHKLAILCIATLRNLIFSGSADNNICVWRRDEGNHICLTVLNGHTGPVKCLAVEHEGQPGHLDQQMIVYSGSLDKSVKIWRVSVQVPTQEQYALTDDFFT